MTRIDAWSGNSWPLSSWVDDHDLGVDTAILIADKPTSIVVIRDGVAQTAQTVRLETLGGQGRTLTQGGVVHSIDALVIGYKGVSGITDTSLQPGDRFAAAGVLYEVLMLMPALTDSVQAYCTVKG